MELVFDTIYRNKDWAHHGNLSGPGSDPHSAQAYIQHLLANYRNRKVLDLGCGDLSIYSGQPFFQSYVGVDVVNIRAHVNLPVGVRVVHSSIVDLPFEQFDFDLIILKDVLQHLSNAAVLSILGVVLKQGVDVLITNDYDADQANVDCADGGWRALALEMAPFSLVIRSTFDWISTADGRHKLTVLV